MSNTFGILRTTLEVLHLPYNDKALRQIAKNVDRLAAGKPAWQRIDHLEKIVGRIKANFENQLALEKRDRI